MSVGFTSLYWLLLAVPIVAFYLLKVRVRRVPVSTLMFWDRMYEEKPPRAIWRQLRDVLSLLLQLLFLILIVAGLCDPRLSSESETQRRIVFVIDNSASMSATDVVPSRLEEAKRQALHRIDRLRAGDQGAIITAATRPSVRSGLTEHPGSLRRAINDISASDGPTVVAEAIAVARELVAGHANSEIVVLSDGCFAGADELLNRAKSESEEATAQASRIEWARIGESADNVAITRFQARRSVQDPVGLHVFCEVQNFGSDIVNCRLELELNGDLLDVIPLKLASQGRWSQTLEKTTEIGGVLTAKIDRDDVLMTDNQARAVVPDRVRQSVTLVSSGHLFLQRVFEANPTVELAVMERFVNERVPSSVLVIHREVPSIMPAGNVLVIQPESSCEFWDVGERLDRPLVGKQDKESLVLANVRLDNVLMPEARELQFKVPVRVLIESATGAPLLAEISHTKGKVLVLTVNLERGDLPLRTAFPILMSNSLSWFSGTGGELHQAVSSGSTYELRIPPAMQSVNAGSGDAELRLTSPQGDSKLVKARDQVVVMGPLDRVGVWTLQRDESPSGSAEKTPVVNVACNLANATESDLTTSIEAAAVRQSVLSNWQRPVWFYLIVLAWLLTGVEWVLHQRRFVR